MVAKSFRRILKVVDVIFAGIGQLEVVHSWSTVSIWSMAWPRVTMRM